MIVVLPFLHKYLKKSHLVIDKILHHFQIILVIMNKQDKILVNFI